MSTNASTGRERSWQLVVSVVEIDLNTTKYGWDMFVGTLYPYCKYVDLLSHNSFSSRGVSRDQH